MNKSEVAVVTDSTAYIPPDLVAKHNLRVIPQIVNWEGESLLDDVDIKPQAFYERLKSATEMPTTSQPSIQQFVDFFTEASKDAQSIVGVFVSDELSGTLNSAHGAARELKDLPIEIVDSRSTSMGLGLITLAAAQAAESGLSRVEVAQAAQALVDRVRVLFVVDTLEFLHRGGRIGGAQRLMGSVLSIKPVLHLQDGRIEPLTSVRTKRKAIQRMLEIAEEETLGKGDLHVSVLNAVAEEEAQFITEQVKNRLDPVTTIQAELSPAIGVHVGPGTVGLAYYKV